ncbi:MAG: hypothetical protein WDO13_19115 [Verrucomicrobiota bacterium]
MAKTAVPGMWNENTTGTGYDLYQDYAIMATGLQGDNVQRPGDGAYGANPMATGASPNPNLADRPIILNRPFRSVGELGYAFRGVEWKTIDFSSAVSGDAGPARPLHRR